MSITNLAAARALARGGGPGWTPGRGRDAGLEPRLEQRGWRLLGVLDPPAIHLTVDVMQSPDLQRFLTDLEESVADIVSGKADTEGLLSYGGVGAEESAPKWLMSAVEIMHAKQQQENT